MTTADRLPRTLGLWSSIGLVIGITIGSGIFRSPAAVARQVSSPAMMIGIWIAGGVITLCGALSFAELGASLPETGGYYAYLREGWGHRAAFLFGWSQLVVVRATALGGVAIVFGEYLLRSLGVDPLTHSIAARASAALAIAFAAATNIAGVRLGATVVSISSAGKFLALGLLIVTAMIFGAGHGGSFGHFVAAPEAAVTGGSIGLALVSVLWAYDGFADLSYVAGEVQNPQRNLPIAIIGGTLSLVGIYVLANIAYVYVLPIDQIRQSPLVAADTMLAILGRGGVVLVSSLVTVAAFSSLNGIMLASPRIFVAMAEDRLLFQALARVHPRLETPHWAILLAALLGTTLAISQTFERLTNTFVLAMWPFYALTVAAIYRLRRRRPDLGRSRRTFGYPVVPAIFIVSVVWFVLNALVTDPIPTGLTFALICTGLPVYEIVSRRDLT